ncbi:MAG: hypothetical protein ACREIA_00560 [Opitutaceae bacterium]
MDTKTAVRYFERKMELISEQLPLDQTLELKEAARTVLSEMRHAGSYFLHALADFEEFYEGCYKDEPTIDWNRIHRTLIAEFGTFQLRKEKKSELTIRRVLKQGRIENEEEGRCVRDFVANQLNEKKVGTKEYEKLALILDTWEANG